MPPAGQTSTAQQLVRVPLTDVSDVHLHRIDDGQWRVLDRRLPSDDVAALLGFVERTGGLYEVTLMGRPREHVPCPDLRCAALTFVEHGVELG
ncbi:hypothetical protein F1C15_09750 [Frigoribacterium sp. NBH87]|uniref:hypothetical protein n=1 Tax=unclassified Frigoribacterium TaxID=2627005 RepID=UPI0016284AD4|nr:MULTISPECIES: hypothetical protein [unclassified Frigoribacterium]MBD8728155.1 hypothetical protein [Frigoribacterium sp. CFBP 13707]QNE44057.1 hypothetical protein F1C15_09750 [Frigoribacterium sp. NBH87]